MKLIVSAVGRLSTRSLISWSAGLERRLKTGQSAPEVTGDRLVPATYRPFFKQRLYFTEFWNQQVSQVLRDTFRPSSGGSLGIYQVGAG